MLLKDCEKIFLFMFVKNFSYLILIIKNIELHVNYIRI